MHGKVIIYKLFIIAGKVKFEFSLAHLTVLIILKTQQFGFKKMDVYGDRLGDVARSLEVEIVMCAFKNRCRTR